MKQKYKCLLISKTFDKYLFKIILKFISLVILLLIMSNIFKFL